MSQSNSNYTLSSSPVSSSGMWDEVASRPRSSASTTSTCGMVVLPNGTPFFVNDKEAYFAANPAARASTQASLRDFGAWSTQDDRAREYEERVKAEKAAKKEREMEDAGLHGCVAGKMLTRCGECAGNGRERNEDYGAGGSLEKFDGKCEDCDGKGFIVSDCQICKANDKKKKGTWSKKPRGGPVCVKD